MSQVVSERQEALQSPVVAAGDPNEEFAYRPVPALAPISLFLAICSLAGFLAVPCLAIGGVGMVLTQTGSQVDAQVQGVAGLALGLVVGSDTFKGNVSGNALDLSISGTMPGSNGTCAYTREARLLGKVASDVITGSVTYRFVTNMTADCGTRNTCQDVQIFNGTRPPKVGP